MIVLDANILLYAFDAKSRFHPGARSWIEMTFSQPEPVGLPWQTIGAFLRIVTNPKIEGERYTVEEAAELVDGWVRRPNIRLLAPGERHWPILRTLMTEGQARGALLTDAQLAALTIEHGGVLYTCDRDFDRFPGLRSHNPLV